MFVLQEELKPEGIEKKLKLFLTAWIQRDDVLAVDFLNRIIVIMPQSPQMVHKRLVLSTSRLSTAIFNILTCDVIRRPLEGLIRPASGPYYRNSSGLHKIFRL